MVREKKEENIVIGRRLSEVQLRYGKTNDQMAYLTGYSVHTYQCVCNGYHGLSLNRLCRLAEDEDFAHEIVYILTGKRSSFDYSVDGNFAYFEALPANEKKTYLAKLASLFARMLSNK